MLEIIEGYIEFLSTFDRFILCCGIFMIVTQLILFLGYVVQVLGLDRTVEAWLNFCSMLMELFPLMGLLGTVVGLLNTFKAIRINEKTGIDVGNLLSEFAPAMTTTVSGIIALAANLFLYICLMQIIWIINRGEVRR